MQIPSSVRSWLEARSGPAGGRTLGLTTHVLRLLIGLFVLGAGAALVGFAPALAQERRTRPGGAPPPGSGPLDVDGFVRVIDGDTLEVRIGGNRVGVGLLGVDAPQGNTDCGRQAAERLRTLVRGGVRLEDDPSLAFDDRKRRMFRVSARDGRPLAEEQVKAGLARADGRGRDRDALAAAEAQARAAGRGCARGGGRAADVADAMSTALTPDDGDATFAALSLDDRALAAVPAAAPPATAPTAAALPGGFTEDVVAGDLTDPTAFAFLPDGRVLVAEKAGTVRVVKGGALLSTPFVDLRDKINDYWDRGLLAIAADPDFATNGHVFLYYIAENDPVQYSGPKTGRLARVTASGDRADPSTETVILGKQGGSSCNALPKGADCLAADNPSHTGGAIRFGSDKSLFLSTGDASSFNLVDDDALRAQDLDSLAGKLIRVSRAGAGLSGNPHWSGDAAATRSKVWARGLRNPFRFGLRPGTDVPYLGDVGWGEWEEVDVATAGANLGWPCYEGTARQAGYEGKAACEALYNQGASAVRSPLIPYDHPGTSASVTGGAFSTGTAYPTQYRGAYFYGDYSQGWIRYARVDDGDRLVGDPTDFLSGAPGPVDIQMGPDGNLYYLAIYTNQLRRIRYGEGTPLPPPPTTSAYVSDLTWVSAVNGWGPVEKDQSNGEDQAGDGLAITLNGRAYAKGLGVHANSDVRYNLGRDCSRLTADVGVDDEASPGATVVFQVLADGTKVFDSGVMDGATPAKRVDLSVAGAGELGLIVTNGLDSSYADHADWADARVTCGTGGNAPPVPTIAAPAATFQFKVGDVIAYSGSATDPEDGAIGAAGLDWEVILHHCPGGACHNHPFARSEGPSGSFTVPDHGDESHFEIKLTATDSGGLTATTSVKIQPRTVKVTLATSPSGLHVVYGGEGGTAPLTRTTIVGSTHTISAPSPQGARQFASWSDGGAQQHNVTVGTADVTYTARFTIVPGKATNMVAPSGETSDTTPTYSWGAVPGVSWYLLFVRGPAGDVFQWYEAGKIGCGAGSGTCSVDPSAHPDTAADKRPKWTLPSGAHQWWVQTWADGVSGPWSDAKPFTIVPGKVTNMVAPSGETSDTTPTYAWGAVPGVTWYFLFVRGPNGDVTQWYEASKIGCGAGSGTCSVDPSVHPDTDPAKRPKWTLPSGAHQWWVQSWAGGAFGPWSDAKPFTVGPAAAVTSSGGRPASGAADEAPTYPWGVASGVARYRPSDGRRRRRRQAGHGIIGLGR